MKGNSRKDKDMDQVFLFGQTEINTKENGIKI